MKYEELIDCNLIEDDDKKLIENWQIILGDIKENKIEYNHNFLYGLRQIDKEINIKKSSGTRNKKNEEIFIPKYAKLDEYIKNFKQKLDEYFEKNIEKKLFEYELLK